MKNEICTKVQRTVHWYGMYTGSDYLENYNTQNIFVNKGARK